MRRQKVAEAAQIAPYLTHLVSHHGRITLVPPENAGRIRKTKTPPTPKSTRKQKPESKYSHSHAQDELRFNSGSKPHATRSPSRPQPTPRHEGSSRRPVSDYANDIPDYPPPSFLEAISTPPFSPVSETQPASPFRSTPSNSSADVHSSDAGAVCSTSATAESDGESESSLDFVEIEDSQVGDITSDSARGRPRSQSRGVLDSESEHEVTPTEITPPRSGTKHRHLSLSPLRTFLSKSPSHERSLSTQPNSPYRAMSRSATSVFRSTTSLPNLLQPRSPIAPSPSTTEHRHFGKMMAKGKHKAENAEDLESWELLPSTSSMVGEDQVDLSSRSAPPSPIELHGRGLQSGQHVLFSPWQGRDYSVHSLLDSQPIPRHQPGRSTVGRHMVLPSDLPSTPPHPPSHNFMMSPASEPSRSEPPLVTIRTRKPPLPRLRKPAAGSPLRQVDTEPSEGYLASSFQRALETPLPSTPTEDTARSQSQTSALTMREMSAASHTHGQNTTPAPPMSLPQTVPISPDTPTPISPTTSTRHYRGRPLPHVPDAPSPLVSRPTIDSVFAGPRTSIAPQTTWLEGDLIDLRDDASVSIPSPVVFQASPPPSPFPPSMNSIRPSPVIGPTFSEFTDLDALVSRLDEEDGRTGSDYDTLLLVQEFMGPAQSLDVAHPSPSSGPASPSWSSPLFGNVTVERRRVTKDGRVKLKLTMRDVSVDKCGICLTQFKDSDSAAMSAACKHVFHDSCLRRWLRQASNCPLCRVPMSL